MIPKQAKQQTKTGSLSRKHSLSRQLLSGFGISLIAVGMATLWVNYRLTQKHLQQQVQKRGQSIAQALEFSTEGLIEAGYESLLDRVVQNYGTLPAVVEIAVISPEGVTIAESPHNLKNRLYTELYPELKSSLEQASDSGVETSRQMVLKNKPVLVQILPFSSTLFGTSGRRGLAIVAMDLKQMQEEAWHNFLTSTLTMAAGTVIILVLMWLFVASTVLGPMKHLERSLTSSKETGSFSMPASMPGNEIGFLAATFEAVFKELEGKEKLQREIAQRRQAEAELRESEARERAKSEELQQAILELKQTQGKLIQTEKMSSLGQLVAGIAHEFNNPLSFIKGNLSPARDYFQDLLKLLHLYQASYPEPRPEIEELAADIELEFLVEDFQEILISMEVGVDRIRDIVLSLRIFSRLGESELKQVDIHSGIDSTLLLLQNRLHSGQVKAGKIEIVKEYSKLPIVECYASELNQVFINILNNAIDALEAGDREARRAGKQMPLPRIRIRTEVVEGERVAIRIENNGAGMTEEVKARLFDPFFTTKPVGKGTGLGLALCYQIVVEKHGGELKCFSEPGQGTQFVIEIPIRIN